MLDQLKGEDVAADTAAEVLLLRIRIASHRAFSSLLHLIFIVILLLI
jgi:hypothetical protein